MPPPSAKGCFVELNDHSLVVVRTSPSGLSCRVERVEEIRCETKSLADGALDAAVPEIKDGAVDAVCVWRPASRIAHLATADEARKNASREAAAALVAQGRSLNAADLEIACVLAEGGAAWDGRSPGRWLAAAATKEECVAVQAALRGWKLAPARLASATLALLGAGHRSVTKDSGPLAVWDVGETASDLFLVNAAGVQAARKVGFGFDEVVEAIAGEMNLRFKASAAKLFFNDLYDFSETGPKIAGRVAVKLQAEIDALKLSSGQAPASFVCAGFTSKQAWFSENLAQAMKMAPWRPEIDAWCAQAGLEIAPDVAAAGVSPAWLGVLGVVAAYRDGSFGADRPWQAAWFRDPKTAPAPKAVEAPAPVVVAKPEVKAAPAPKPAQPAPAPVAAPAAKVPEKPAAKPAPAPVPAKVEAKPVAAPVAKAPEKPAAKPAPAPAKPEAKPAPAAAPAAAKVEAPKPAAAGKKPFFATPVGIAAAVGLLAVLGGGYLLYQRVEAQKQAMMAEMKKAADERAAADAEALRQIRQKVAEEAAARQRAEELAASQSAAAEAARKQAEQEAVRREAEARRLLNARGSIRVVSEPAGATVTIDNLAARETPAVFSDLRLGRYAAQISYDGYETATVEFDVKENAVADRGVIRLARHTGSLEVVSQPNGIPYEVRPVSARFVLSSPDIRRGQTPAKVDGLPTGEYIVSLRREGWPAHTESIVVQNKETARVSRTFSGGAVNITSNPQGATVSANGVVLGVTPLTLADVREGPVTYSMAMDDFHPATVSGVVVADKPLDLSASLEVVDRIRKNSELDERPVAIKTVYPQLGEQNQFKGNTVVFTLVVDKDGTPRDIRVEKSTNDALTALCRQAVEQWLFKPATVRGQAVKARVAVPFVIQ